MIDNLAQFKRAMTLGSRWESIYLLNCNEEPKIRVVTQVQTNGVYLSLPDSDEDSFMQFGKATEYDFIDGNIIIAKWPDGRAYAQYTFLEAA